MNANRKEWISDREYVIHDDHTPENDALVEVVLAGLREGWRDDYSARTVAAKVAEHLRAAGYAPHHSARKVR